MRQRILKEISLAIAINDALTKKDIGLILEIFSTNKHGEYLNPYLKNVLDEYGVLFYKLAIKSETEDWLYLFLENYLIYKYATSKKESLRDTFKSFILNKLCTEGYHYIPSHLEGVILEVVFGKNKPKKQQLKYRLTKRYIEKHIYNIFTQLASNHRYSAANTKLIFWQTGNRLLFPNLAFDVLMNARHLVEIIADPKLLQLEVIQSIVFSRDKEGYFSPLIDAIRLIDYSDFKEFLKVVFKERPAEAYSILTRIYDETPQVINKIKENYLDLALILQQCEDSIIITKIINSDNKLFAECVKCFDVLRADKLKNILSTAIKYNLDNIDSLELNSTNKNLIEKLFRHAIEFNVEFKDMLTVFSNQKYSEILSMQGNILLKTSISKNNDTFIRYMLHNNMVRGLAEHNDYYFKEELKLANIVNDSESSMRSLTDSQLQKLNMVFKRYEHNIHKVHKWVLVLGNFRNYIIKRYEAEPEEYKGIKLPAKWHDFQKLKAEQKWSDDNVKEVMKKYYGNYLHSAYRYLTFPNFWLESPRYINITTKSYSSKSIKYTYFLGYQELIACLWLAASDENEPGLDGFTVETRIDMFIRQISLINRAHNWDNGDRDDLKSDNPSCFSGTRKRLFQGLLGHSATHVPNDLTYEKFDDLINSFIRNFYKDILNKSSIESLIGLKEAVDNYFIMLEELPDLSAFNIPDAVLAYFKYTILKQFGNKLVGNKEKIVNYVNKKTDRTMYGDSYILKYYSITGVQLSHILNKALDDKAVPKSAINSSIA